MKRIPALSKAGVLLAVGLTTVLSAWVGYDQKSQATLADIVTPQARAVVERYEDRTARIAGLTTESTELAGLLRDLFHAFQKPLRNSVLILSTSAQILA